MSDRFLLDVIPAQPQRQDSLSSQLADLRAVANRLGMYDAADALGHIFDLGKLDGIKYGCHCDLEEGMEPDGCVINEGKISDCIYAKKDMRPEHCSYWRPIYKR